MRKTFLVSLIAVLAILAIVPFVLAENLDMTVYAVAVDDMEASFADVAVEAGEVVPIDIYFEANENANEVQVSAWMQGHRSDAVEKDFADLISGKSYHAKVDLKMPTDIDPEEDLTLYVRIESDAGNWEESYVIGMQREPYKTELLFVDVDSKVEAGKNLAIDVVAKNLGRHELEDLVVSVSIDELGISKKAYFGDLTPVDNAVDDNDEDTMERSISLRIPSDAESGVYELKVKAYNSDAEEVITKNIAVEGEEEATRVIAPVESKEVSLKGITSYDVVIVNSGSKVGVYKVVPVSAEGLAVSVENPVVVVAAGSSEIVKVNVEGLEKGTYNFAVDVSSDGKVVDQVSLNAVVSKGSVVRSNIAVLTVVLAIVFIVLLIVLIVLLTRKTESVEELEESYY